ncbi:hypothetical protein PAXRUDRAFT_661122 [Paxillus rubicundulus Ve08.2h10]|uniref:Uncharacterized protein n=1 Tax=Paxillus rubicundulus Ve08.2h10 TaxID=930991 RepID=A0A0D0DJM0_9AGAM|nr:hypothetical protein PAXRUDRAFT_661122 [Paxillus rubicundulus Ve08.2h10]
MYRLTFTQYQVRIRSPSHSQVPIAESNDRPITKSIFLFSLEFIILTLLFPRYILFILDTFHSASASIYMAWTCTVTNYDNPAALAARSDPISQLPRPDNSSMPVTCSTTTNFKSNIHRP